MREAWVLLPRPTVEIARLDRDSLNWFESTNAFFARRMSNLSTVIMALEVLQAGGNIAGKVITTRYPDGLPDVSFEKRGALLESLRRLLGPAADPER